jgi:hypothetical protein
MVRPLAAVDISNIAKCKMQNANCKLQDDLRAYVRIFISQFAFCNLQFAIAGDH